MKPQPEKQRILDSLAAMAKGVGRTPSRREFFAQSGIPESTVLRFFPNWNAAVRAAGLEPNIRSKRHEDRELLEDWGRAVRKNGKCLTVRAYHRLGKFGGRTLEHRFDRWSKIPQAFRKFARWKTEWADVVSMLPAPKPLPQPASNSESGQRFPARSPLRRASPSGRDIPPSAKIRNRSLRGRPTYGQPLNFRGLRHEPINEQGVVLLFGMVAKELGYIVEAVQSSFPDCEAKRQIAPQRWQRVHLEFEFESRNYRDHGHPLAGCDVIVCWRHNWPDHPQNLEILELSALLPSLSASDATPRTPLTFAQ